MQQPERPEQKLALGAAVSAAAFAGDAVALACGSRVVVQPLHLEKVQKDDSKADTRGALTNT